MWLALAPGAVLFAFLQTFNYAAAGHLGLDSHAYWLAARDPSSWYTLPPAYTDAYLYSPVFAQVLKPLGALPWPAFQLIWAVAGLTVLVWLVRPLGWWRGLIAAMLLVPDVLIGNVYLFFALVLVLTVRGVSGPLALPLLTKVGPAVVGLWHAVRGEWRAVLWAATSTAVVVGASVAVSPDAWLRWLDFLGTSTGSRGTGAAFRVAIATALVVYAARKNRPWLLAPAMVLACPVLGGYAALAVLAAIPRLRLWEHARPADSSLPAPWRRDRGSEGKPVGSREAASDDSRVKR